MECLDIDISVQIFLNVFLHVIWHLIYSINMFAKIDMLTGFTVLLINTPT